MEYGRMYNMKANNYIFWNKCNHLTTTSPDVKVQGSHIWDTCGKSVKESAVHDHTLFGLKINCEPIQRKVRLLENDKRINEILQCGIWIEPVDSENHLLTNCCSKIWCFYCIINSLKQSNACPNCRKPVRKNMLKKLPLVTELFEKFELINKKVQKGCQTHDKQLEIFCEEWKLWICVSCIPNHRTHTLSVIEEKFTELDIKIK